MEEPLPDFDPLAGGRLPARDPLHRTRRTSHTRHADERRELHHLYEEAEFDADGYLSHRIDEQVLCLDCDCNAARGMAGQCLFCSPPARLCAEHLLHCDVCGRGMCRIHALIVPEPEKTRLRYYCPRHGRFVRIKRFVRGIVLAVVAPVITRDAGDRA